MYISTSRAVRPPSAEAPEAAETPVTSEVPETSEVPAAAAAAPGRSRAWAGVDSNVLALGSVSLVTDISSEMITAVLPMYVIFTLGLSPLQFGALNGMYFGVTALVRVAG